MKTAVGILGAVALVVAGVSSSADAQQPKRGGTLRFAVSAEPPNYDCHGATSFAFIHPVRPHYNTLLKFDEPNYPKVKGDLAQSWEVAKDGLTYTFKLKPNIKFHDGTPLTSEDVKASYERISKPPKGVVSIRAAAYADIASIETPSPDTVVFKLKEPNASMLTNFASPWDCIYSAAKLKQDPNFPIKNVLGSGPFKFVRHEAGSRWIGERFTDYFEKDRPYLDGYEAIFITNTAASVNALAAGEVLAEFRGLAPADRDRVLKTAAGKVDVHESPWVCNLVVSFNTEKKPFDDARVRRALSLAVDRWGGAKGLAKVAVVRDVGGVLRPGYSLAASEKDLVTYPGFSKDIKASRAEARKLLAEAGVKNLKFKFMNRNVPQPYTYVGVFLVDQWRQIGVTAEHEQPETRAYIANLRSGNYEVGLDFNCDAVDDPNLQLAKYLSAKRSPINYGRYTDEKLDRLYEAQQAELDEKKRYAILREFEKHALEQAYTFPTIWWHRIVVTWKQLRGWHMSPSHYINQDLQDVWLAQ